MAAWQARRSLALLLVTVIIGAAGGPAHAQPPAPAPFTPGNNVLFVLTDDMRFDDMQYLPQVRQLIGDQGMTFDNEFDNVTLCCPARTSILRGQYSHNTGVLTNGGGNGGFEAAHANGDEQSTIGTAMRSAGYTTGLFGKYLNGYPNTAGVSFIPPGWDSWASATRGNPYGEYNYTLNENGKQVRYGNKPEDYGTDVYVAQTKEFINQAAQSGKPFFAYLAVYARRISRRPRRPRIPRPSLASRRRAIRHLTRRTSATSRHSSSAYRGSTSEPRRTSTCFIASARSPSRQSTGASPISSISFARTASSTVRTSSLRRTTGSTLVSIACQPASRRRMRPIFTCRCSRAAPALPGALMSRRSPATSISRRRSLRSAGQR
jgi:hypothetical protein